MHENKEMSYWKPQNLVGILLFFGCFAFVILSILIDSLSSLDRDITKLQVIIVDEPVFYFSGLDQPSFYSFSCEDYKCDFRISDETLKVVSDNGNVREQIKNIKFHDTLDIFIQNSETERLQKRKNVHIVGLLKNNDVIIDPTKVFEIDKEGIKTSAFLFSICGIGAAIWLVRKYMRVKAQRTKGGFASTGANPTQHQQQ